MGWQGWPCPSTECLSTDPETPAKPYKKQNLELNPYLQDTWSVLNMAHKAT